MSDRIFLPYGVYDSKECCLAHVGLYFNEDDCWRVYLGWPDESEIEDAKARGLRVIPLTIHYTPPDALKPVTTGWQIVPVEPTADMNCAAVDVFRKNPSAPAMYRAMLLAAPVAQSPG